MTADSGILDIQNLEIGHKNPGGFAPVVRGVSLTVPRGRTMALVGESGSGKTTIAQGVMGLLPASARIGRGAILFDDVGGIVDITAMEPNSPRMRALRGRQIGMIFQEPSAALSPVHTIGDLLTESLRTHEPVTREDAIARATTLLARVGFDRPAEALAMYPFELSGGLRQRAMIAAALICRPALLIADEPTSALDVTVQALLLKLIADLQAEFGMSVLLITHDLGVVATIAHDMCVLYRGEVMERGPARDLLKQPEHPYLKALLRAGPSLIGGQTRLTPLRPIPPPPEAFQRHWTHTSATPTGEPLLAATGLSLRFGARNKSGQGVQALNGVSLTIKQGECLGLVGESGCGKSTLSKVLMNALPVDEGAVAIASVDGLVPIERIPQTDYSKRVQYVFQDPFGSLNPRHTVRDALVEPFEIHAQGTRAERDQWAAELLSLVGLPPQMLGRYPNAFSGGQRQRIAIARALALKPDLLICDEPVSALDVSVQAQIVNLLQDLKASLGMTYLFVSHNLAVVRHLADRVAVMCRGRIVELAPVDALFGDPIHPYTRALIASAPDADPDRNMDLSALLDGRASDPSAWEPPYRLLGDAKPRYEMVGPDHTVAVASLDE